MLIKGHLHGRKVGQAGNLPKEVALRQGARRGEEAADVSHRCQGGLGTEGRHPVAMPA